MSKVTNEIVTTTKTVEVKAREYIIKLNTLLSLMMRKLKGFVYC